MTPEARAYLVDRIFAEFFAYLQEKGKSPRTIRGYRTDLELFSDWFQHSNGKPVSLRTITPTDIREYRQFLRMVAKQKPATVNRKLAALFSLCAWALSSGHITASFTSDIELVKKSKLSPRALTKQEEGRLLREAEVLVAAAKTDPARLQALRDLTIIKILLHTGLRIFELCALDMRDFELSPHKGFLYVRSGKGDKPGKVPLNPIARKALREWLDIRPKSLSPRLFLGRRSNTKEDQLTPSAVERRFRIIGRRADVDASPHTLRHTFATRLRERGVSPIVIKELMRLETMEMVARYAQPSEHDLEIGVEQLVG